VRDHENARPKGVLLARSNRRARRPVQRRPSLPIAEVAEPRTAGSCFACQCFPSAYLGPTHRLEEAPGRNTCRTRGGDAARARALGSTIETAPPSPALEVPSVREHPGRGCAHGEVDCAIHGFAPGRDSENRPHGAQHTAGVFEPFRENRRTFAPHKWKTADGELEAWRTGRR